MLTKQQIERIKTVLSQCGFIKEAWLFGSYAKNQETPSSDLDIMYNKIDGVHYGLFALMGTINKLEEETGKKIDLVHIPSMHERVRQSAEKHKVKIYEKK